MSLPFLRMGMHPGMLSTFLATEVGGAGGLPDAPLAITGPGEGLADDVALISGVAQVEDRSQADVPFEDVGRSWA